MAVTWTGTLNRNNVWGHERAMDFSFLATGTYTTGGDAITAAQVGLDVIDLMLPVVDVSAGSGTPAGAVLAWNNSTGKMQLFVQGTAGAGTLMVELTNGTTITGFGFRAIVLGVD